MTSETAAPPEFQVRHVSRIFRDRGAGQDVTAVRDVSFDVSTGQRLGIVGESGSGKSTLVRMLAALMTPTEGSIQFRGQEIGGLGDRQLGFFRSQVQLVFQDPRSSLNPRMKVLRIIAEPLRSPFLAAAKNMPTDKAARIKRCHEVMRQVELDPDLADRYPHEFSGGQRQRIAIARALAPNPAVLIADEAVSALDVSVRAHVLNLVSKRVHEDGLTLLFVSHDLSVVRHVCDSVLVMRAGAIVESGPVEQIYNDPQEAYTKELLAAVPKIKVAAR